MDEQMKAKIRALEDAPGSVSIWGIPVVESDLIPGGEVHMVFGSGIVRQDGTLEWNGERFILRTVGEPYDPVIGKPV